MGTVVMLSGISPRRRGLKIPCGPIRGTRWPSYTNPCSSTLRGRAPSSDASLLCSSRNRKAASRTSASMSAIASARVFYGVWRTADLRPHDPTATLSTRHHPSIDCDALDDARILDVRIGREDAIASSDDRIPPRPRSPERVRQIRSSIVRTTRTRRFGRSQPRRSGRKQ